MLYESVSMDKLIDNSKLNKLFHAQLNLHNKLVVNSGNNRL